MAGDFTFVPPPEAPVFRPTEEEFDNPLNYIMKIRHIGTKTGICKIIPPKAQSRIKLNFISRLYKYIRCQGGDKIRVPSIGGRFLDLHALHKQVHDAGGYDKVCKDHLWASVAEKLGYPGRFTYSIKVNYEKLLLAFDQIIYSSDHEKNPETIDLSSNKELRNLRFYGPGPKAAVPTSGHLKLAHTSQAEIRSTTIDDFRCRICSRGDDESNLLVCDTESCQACYHTYCLKPPLRSVPKCQWTCPMCIRALCTQPPDPYGFPQSNKCYALHEFGVMADEFKSNYFGRLCSEVPCSVVEQEFWRILQEYNDDVVVEYGADIHSSSQGSGFPTINRLQNLVGTAQQLEEAKMYAINPWNLNILPLLDRSVLRFIKGNIDGMKIPWCYVGMVFSSFCWHIEDHWSYSINFNHWGEPKTWYGVSRLHADDFERAMWKHAPELFEQAPDLLHHITTNMNPNILQAEGVPVYRTDQYCGEFVVTFPRAYHAGFNQGFNFAEAVNICLPDWLPIGRACVEHYAQMKRHCVFSNNELLCTLAEVAVGRCRPEEVLQLTNPCRDPEKVTSLGTKSDVTTKPCLPAGCSTAGLDISAVAIVHQEFTILLSEERRLRQLALNLGIAQMERVRFDELSDDVRVCDACLTTLFLSGISCPCAASPVQSLPGRLSPAARECHVSPNKKRKSGVEGDVGLENPADAIASCGSAEDDPQHIRRYIVCLHHCDQLCSECTPSTWTLKYHYTIEELEDLERSLAICLESFYAWRDSLTKLVSTTESKLKQDQNPQLTVVGVKPESPDLPKEGTVRTNFVMSLSDLRDKISIGRDSCYHTDDVFVEADAILERAEHLVHVCAMVRSTILSASVNTEQSSTSPNLVRFQFRLPATPRELDVGRLLDACKQLHPLNVMTEPDVQQLDHFLSRLSEWRQSVRKTAACVCRLSLTTATRNLVMHCPITYEDLDCKQMEHLSSDEQVLVLLSRVLMNIGEEYPGFAHRLPEWALLNLLNQAVKWLCIYQKQSGENEQSIWTLPHLRKHSSVGESLLGQLNEYEASRKADSNSRHATPSSNSTLEVTMAPVSRLLQARMHTALGHLSQLIVQIDSLITILCETLGVPGSFSCSEVQIVLAQFQSLKVNHLVLRDFSDLQDKVADSGANEKTLVTGSSAIDFKTTINVDNLLKTSIPSEEATQPPELVLRLHTLLTDRVRQLLAQRFDRTYVPITSRPQLTQAEVLLALGSLFDSPSPTDATGSPSASAEPRFQVDETLKANLRQLSALVTLTNQTSRWIHEKLLGENICDPASDVPFIKLLIPRFPNEAHNANNFEQFMDVYAKSPTDAEKLFDDLARRSQDAIRAFLTDALFDGTLCFGCAQQLGPNETSGSNTRSIDTLLRSNMALLDSITAHMDPMLVSRLTEVRRTVACIPTAPNSTRDSRSVCEQSKLFVSQLQTMLGVGLTFSIRLDMECRFLRCLVSVLMPKANSN
ncbi:histone demethylase JARID1 [Paragonimus westermani]|uniref:[histone H3]-trimethyl-L-lysine(4) demethylase n=1 Tax=Paragonimus westermani TaxID=34504 RepID=A0A5J4NXT0_9TREM|nr:histone demethylase JARID1 [Paragonimus westermani]